MATTAYDRFLASMKTSFDNWRDGTGYDLDALAQTTPEEQKAIEKLLLAKRSDDWRVVEALGALGTQTALTGLRTCLRAQDPIIRLAATRELHAKGELVDLTEIVIGAMRSGNGLAFSQAIDMIGWHKVMGAVPELLRMCASGSGENACHCAAMLYFLHGISNSAFDWDHRPFFLRFNADVGDADRQAAFRELCEKIGVRPEAPPLRTRRKCPPPGRKKT